MELADLADVLTGLARPFSIYASSLAVAIGIFVPSVTSEKLGVAAALAAGVSIARSIDKHAAAKYGASQPGDPA